MRAIAVTTTLSILIATAGCGGSAAPRATDPEKATTELKALQELRQKEGKSSK